MPEAGWNFQLLVGPGFVVPVGDTEYRARREAEQEQRAKAEAKAKETFLGLLSEENRKRYTEDGHIVITGSNGETYQIFFGYSNNVVHAASGIHYCAYPVGMVDHEERPIPYHDAMIAQMLMLVTDESLFLDIAY